MHRVLSRLALVGGVSALLVLAGCESRPYPPPEVESFVHAAEVPTIGSAAETYPQARLHITAEGIDHVLAVRAAVTDEQRDRGLADVPHLPNGSGLLMLFPEPENRGGVTIEGVRMVLDIAFIDNDGQIVSVFTGNPCRSRPCTVYDPERPYRAVLQLPVGWLARHHVTTGDTVTWEATLDADPTN